MKDLPPGFPREKSKKPKKFPGTSAKTAFRMEERRQVIKATHERSHFTCEAAWIAPDIKCSPTLFCDETWTRGRSGGISQYDNKYTQSLCEFCDCVKENEVSASEILNLYGRQGQLKHEPISEEDIMGALMAFRKRKRGCSGGS